MYLAPKSDMRPMGNSNRIWNPKGFAEGEKRWHIIDPILKFTVGLFLVSFSDMPLSQCRQEFLAFLPSFLCKCGEDI
jgi:hypothetical protein